MLLAIDIGNSNVVMGGIRENQIVFQIRIATDPIKTSDQYGVEIKNMLDLSQVQVAEIDDCIISSVVPPLSPRLFQALKLLKDVRVYTVGPGLKTGLNIKIDNPSQLGSDLVCVAVAAVAKYPAPSVIIDMSTATTFSAVDSRKNLVGCSIVPGVELSLNALAEGTAQLQKIDLDEPVRSVVGRNTIESMRAGSVYGNASLIDGMIARFRAELVGELSVIATGAQAPYILPYCGETIIYDKNLLLDGLRLIYEKNRR